MRIRRIFGKDAQEVVEKLRQFQADINFFSENYETFQRKYSNHWVVVYKGEVIGHSKTLGSLGRLLDKLERKGFPRGDVYCRFVYEKGKEPKFILSLQGSFAG